MSNSKSKFKSTRQKDFNPFKPNKNLQSSIDQELHLNEAEEAYKKLIDEYYKECLRLNEEREYNKRVFGLECLEHFQEIRRKINLQRDEMKDEIDKIALVMLNNTKEFEALFMKRFMPNEDIALAIGQKRMDLDEKFRCSEPLLHFEAKSIEELQSSSEKSIAALNNQLKLIEEMKNHFISTNDFKPNLSLDKSSFGSLNWSDYYSLSESKILGDGKQVVDLGVLCEFSSNDNWSLLYRGTRDGFSSKDFHLRCDDEPNTLTLIKAKNSDNIFGGYTEAKWQSAGGDTCDHNAFIFSLMNKLNQPCKLNVSNANKAIFCDSRFGPIFGGSYSKDSEAFIRGDIRVADNGNENENSVSQLSDAYKHPRYAFETSEANTLLAGSQQFKLDEIEVYKRIKFTGNFFL